MAAKSADVSVSQRLGDPGMRGVLRRRFMIAIGIAPLVGAMPVHVSAQTSGTGTIPQRALQPLMPTKAAPQAATQTRPVVPSPDQLLGLIRTTVIALNQANQTGNYTVLRDLAAPDFRNGNDASRLGAIFQVLREQAVDLTPLLQISPELSEPPSVNQYGLLRLNGFFPTEPLRVNFDLSFQMWENRWRPYTISVYLARLEARLEAPVLKPKAAEVKK
jgi:hypothetical protein